MSTLEKLGVPLENGKFGGIIQPQPSYRFRLVPKVKQTLITSNVEKCDFDLKNKNFTLYIRQVIFPEFFLELEDVITHNNKWRVDFLDGASEVIYSLDIRTKLESATFTLDYSTNGYITHKLKYTFNDYTVLTPDNSHDTSEDNTKKVDGFLTAQEAIEQIKKDKENEGKKSNG